MVKNAEVQSLEELPLSDYFRTSNEKVELKWTIGQLKILENCNLNNEEAYDQANYSFWRLKALFCKEEGGKGNSIRFGIARIESLCQIYHPKTQITYGGSYILQDLVDDGLFPLSNKDYTNKIIYLIKSFNENSLKEIRIGFECEADNSREYSIYIELKERFTPGTRGHDFGNIKNALKNIAEYNDSSFHTVTIKFRIRKDDEKNNYWILTNSKPCIVEYA